MSCGTESGGGEAREPGRRRAGARAGGAGAQHEPRSGGRSTALPDRPGPLSRLEPPIWARAIRQIARRGFAVKAGLLAPPPECSALAPPQGAQPDPRPAECTPGEAPSTAPDPAAPTATRITRDQPRPREGAVVTVDSVYLPCTFPEPSLYLPCNREGAVVTVDSD